MNPWEKDWDKEDVAVAAPWEKDWSGEATSDVSTFRPAMPEYDEPVEDAESAVDRAYASKRDVFARKLGVQPEQINWDMEAPPGLGRAWAGFMDTDEERTRAFRSRAHPDAEIKTVEGEQFVKLRPDEQWIPFDKAGLTIGDVYDMASDIPEAITALVSTLRGATPMGVALRAAIAQTGEEGVKTAAGYTPDPTAPLVVGGSEYLGVKGGELLGKPISAVINRATGRAPTHVRPEVMDAYRNIQEQFGEDAPMLMPHQLSDSKILQRSAAQSRYTAETGILPLERQQQAWSAAQLRELGETPSQKGVVEQQRRALQQITEDKMQKITKGVPTQTPYTAGEKMQKAVDLDIATQGRVVSKAYNLTDEAAALERPVFDLSQVQAKATEIMGTAEGIVTRTKQVPNIVSPTGQTITTKTVPVKGVQDVSDVPRGELDAVIDDIMQLDPQQFDYNVVKSLRTRLYGMVDNPRYGWDANKYQALKLYNTLSDALKNPVNNAPTYTKMITRASSLAKNRFDLMKQSEIRQILDSDNPYYIGQMIEVGQLTPDVVRSIQRGGQTSALKAGLNHKLINSENPTALLNNWRTNHPEIFSKIVTKKEANRLDTMVRHIEVLRGQKATQIANETLRVSNTVSDLAASYDKQGVQALANRMNDGQKNAFKKGIYMDFLNKSLEYTDKGGMFVNPEKFKKVYQMYNESGMLNTFLNATDRARLRALDDYVMLSNGSLKDVGAALEGAKLISQLKDVSNPKNMARGAISLKINTLISNFMASPAGNKVMLGWSDKAPFTDKGFRALGVALASMQEE